ncbi:BON domain-containing protein [Cupriavidus sp. DB3]|uniref:BON domain-containing protein n=1 Tax=Cupriavidus sp. DB3 TaxID=2873259 RepID=UPI001CF4434F|nr:BON domain-containing protein [Cupriavidus sp. DB3]MCA7083550.1 BON domain-containing protein [Cupriavidus sp. DB3]
MNGNRNTGNRDTGNRDTSGTRQMWPRETGEDRRGRGTVTGGMEWFPEDPRTGEVAETWRHRGYGGSRGMRDAYHYRRGDTGAMGSGGGSVGFNEFGERGASGGAGMRGSTAPRRARTLPKGYRRTDERICDEVCERLAEARDLDVSEVTVEVGSGIVTLSGTVSDRRAKYRVEDIAEEVMGVDEVRNNIRVPR